MNDGLPGIDSYTISSVAELEALYGLPSGAAVAKELNYISEPYRAFVEKAPFVIIASSGPGGVDCTPRGDPAGFVRVVNNRTVLIPDRRGNNRLDTLRNLVADPRIGLLFLIPGVGETLRINGRARITTDPALCANFEMQRQLPKSVIEVTTEQVYFQCPKALVRSKLWDPATQVPRSALPSAGQMLQAIADCGIDGETYDKAYPDRLKQTIY